MSAEVLPDTNVILRYLLEDVPEQSAKAGAFFEKVRTGAEQALLLESVVVECVYMLTKYYEVPRREVAATLTELLHYRGVVNSDKDVLIAGLTFFCEHKLDIVDCLLLARATYCKNKVFTFDKKLAKLASAVAGAKTTP